MGVFPGVTVPKASPRSLQKPQNKHANQAFPRRLEVGYTGGSCTFAPSLIDGRITTAAQQRRWRDLLTHVWGEREVVQREAAGSVPLAVYILIHVDLNRLPSGRSILLRS